ASSCRAWSPLPLRHRPPPLAGARQGPAPPGSAATASLCGAGPCRSRSPMGLVWRAEERGEHLWILCSCARRYGGTRNALISPCGRSPRGMITKSDLYTSMWPGPWAQLSPRGARQRAPPPGADLMARVRDAVLPDVAISRRQLFTLFDSVG